MRLSLIALVTAFGQALAHPGMGAMMDGILNEIEKRQPGGPPGSTELIGDLATLPDNQLTPVGQELKGILQLTILPTDDVSTYTKPGTLNSPACAADTCCVWSYIADAMEAAFLSGGQCNALARGAVRLGFHDAATWHRTQGFGGADGSILLSASEMSRADNNGLQPIAAQMNTWFSTYSSHGISMADLIQFGAKVAARVCPGGPRTRTFVGRVDSSTANPAGLLPDPNSPAGTLISLFENKTIVAGGLVALVGAHTVSRQQNFNPGQANVPQDTTPGLWDRIFYVQTRAATPPPGILRFPSDVALANFPSTQGLWFFFGTPFGGAIWNRAYAAEYIRLSMLGVNNMNTMTECTKVLP